MSDPERGIWTSASNAEADSLCPGRHKAQLGLPEEPAQQWTESGQVIHALWTGTKPLREPTEDEILKAEVLREQEDAVVAQWANGQKTERTCEQRLWIRVESYRHSGRFDVRHIISPNRFLILDGKTGWLDVAPNPSNLQLRDLVALEVINDPMPEGSVGILKPFGKTPPLCVYDALALVTAIDEMEQRVIACNAANAPRVPGEIQCRYCRAKLTCPEFARAALPLEEVPEKCFERAKAVLPGCVAAMPGDRLARAWTLAKMLVTLAEAELRRRISDGKDAGGAYLEPGNIQRPIDKPQEAYQRALEDGMTPQAFMGCVSVAKGDLEKALKDVHRTKVGKDRLPKGYWEPVWKQFCDGICGEKQNAPSLKWSEKQLTP